MHIVFSEGEKFFIRSGLCRFAKDVKDKELKQEINSFADKKEFMPSRTSAFFWEVMEEQQIHPNRYAAFWNYTR